MKIIKILLMMTLAVLAGCQTSESDENLIGRQVPETTGNRLTPELLWSLGRISEVQFSPEKQQLLYGVTYFSVEKNISNRELFIVNIDGTNVKQITHTNSSEHAAKWVKNGSKIAFLSSQSGSQQLWEMNSDGSNRKQITNRDGGITDFIYSPDNKKILFVADVKYGTLTKEIYPDLPQATGVIVNDLMYKHWDEWVSSVPHPFVADLTEKGITNERDLLDGEPYESPMKPFGGIEQMNFSPDSKKIAYTCRKKTGLDYALSTNSDIYIYDIEKAITENATQGMEGYDTNPVFSPDGKYLSWLSMKRDGYESDKNRLFILDLISGEKIDLSADFDYNVESFSWNDDTRSIYFTACRQATTQIYRVDIVTQEIKQLTFGQHDYSSVLFAGKKLVGLRHSMSYPDEIFVVDETSGLQTPVSSENKHLLDKIEMGRVEKRWIETTDNKQMLTWIVYPPDFDSTKKYPALLYCQGGPQSAVSQFWSYRWNLQIMAANGYIVVAPNRRGLPGFGQEWNEQISGDYGGQCMKDYLSAIDAVKKDSFVDENHLGCVGASFGGYSVYWLAGHHEKRFKAFIAHDGIFNLEQQYVETEEMWFANWDLGGAYWEKDNAVAQRSYANSPHRFVDKWDTPILCIHGEKDYRILASQGMAAFNAAKLRGIPAQLLIFPDENHWVLKPQNGILWQRVFFNWLDKWLK